MIRTSYDSNAHDDVPRPVLRLVDDLDDKHTQGHNRIREDIEDLRTLLRSIEKLGIEHTDQLKHIAKRTTDISALRFTPATVAWLIILCASIIGGFYGATWGVRDDVRDIKTTMADQAELRKAETKLQDERAATMAEAIREIKARGEMTDLKVNNLRETVLTRK